MSPFNMLLVLLSWMGRGVGGVWLIAQALRRVGFECVVCDAVTEAIDIRSNKIDALSRQI